MVPVFLHHDQVEVPVTVEDLLDGHQAAAVFFGVTLSQLGRGLAQGMVCRDVLEAGGHRVAGVRGIAGVEHDVGHLETVGGDSPCDARKVMDDGVGLVVFQGVQHRVDVGPSLVQKEEGHRGGHPAVILFLLAAFIVLVVLGHPGGDGDELCPGGLNDVAEGLGGEVGHPHSPLHQFGDQGQGGVDVAKSAQRYKRDVHKNKLSFLIAMYRQGLCGFWICCTPGWRPCHRSGGK